MRGKVQNQQVVLTKDGITPAYAGKSRMIYSFDEVAGDHPRVCGEKALYYCEEYQDVGSPPRMRGKAPSRSSGPFWSRITPAYAGKSI